MKILYVFTVGGTGDFFISLIRRLKDSGHQVDIACSDTDRVNQCYRDWGCEIFELHCSRNPLDSNNRKAIDEIREIVTANHYDIVHCHTPVAAFCTRVACKSLRKDGVKVFYTAHGFHFFKGAPKKYWAMFYPLERMCSKWTDLLITINHEDYERAKAKMKAEKTVYVPGVGVNVDRFRNAECDRKKLREELGVKEDDFLLLSVGELSDRKNHRIVIQACNLLFNEKIHYVIAGEGDKREELTELISGLNHPENIHLLGRREDIPQLCKAADCFILPSFQEGLPVALMEAMASGLPALGADIRGVNDLIGEDRRFDPRDDVGIAKLIDRMYSSPEWREQVVAEDALAITNYSEESINNMMMELYEA